MRNKFGKAHEKIILNLNLFFISLTFSFLPTFHTIPFPFYFPLKFLKSKVK